MKEPEKKEKNTWLWVTLAAGALAALTYGGKKTMDYVFTKDQEAKLNALHPSVRDTFKKFIAELQKRGWQVIITNTFRTFSEQVEIAKKNGKSPSFSFHNFGFALDFNAIKNGQHLKMATPKATWEASGIPALAKSMGLRWGGNFSNFYDPVHVDAGNAANPSKHLADLLAAAKKQYGNDLTKIKGNEVKLFT